MFLKINFLIPIKFKILCGLSHCFALYVYTMTLRYAIEWMTAGNPVVYFRLFECVFSVSYHLIIVKCIWLNKYALLKILNFTGTLDVYVGVAKTRQDKKVINPVFTIEI